MERKCHKLSPPPSSIVHLRGPPPFFSFFCRLKLEAASKQASGILIVRLENLRAKRTLLSLSSFFSDFATFWGRGGVMILLLLSKETFNGGVHMGKRERGVRGDRPC